MKKLATALCMFAFLQLTTMSFASDFGNEGGSIWADTPVGKFECRADKSTKYRQVLKINGYEIYREPDHLTINSGGNSLLDGISMGPRQDRSPGCPKIIENKLGYVVYEYDQAREISNNPHVDVYDASGVINYEIINFNVSPPTIISLTQVKLRDGKAYQTCFTWDNKGFIMRYYGYPFDKIGEYPKPKFHTIRFDFATQKISSVK
jgi:hypothetical protein